MKVRIIQLYDAGVRRTKEALAAETPREGWLTVEQLGERQVASFKERSREWGGQDVQRSIFGALVRPQLASMNDKGFVLHGAQTRTADDMVREDMQAWWVMPLDAPSADKAA